MKHLMLSSLLILSAQSFAIPNPGRAAEPKQEIQTEQDGLLQKAAVMPGDGRKELLDSKYPWGTIGRLFRPNGSSCSASLIGANLVLTAAHCVVHKDSPQVMLGNYRFEVGYRRGRSLASAGVIRIWPGTKNYHDTDNDWAVLELDARLGDRFGWLGVHNLNAFGLVALGRSYHIYQAGYDTDFQNMEVPYWQVGCTFPAAVPNREHVMHDCSTMPGSSGSAIFMWDHVKNQFYVVAVHVAGWPRKGVPFSYENANLAVPASKFSSLVGQLRGR